VKNMGGESEAAPWTVGRAILDDLDKRGLKTPELLIIDGAAGLEKALAALWPEVPTPLRGCGDPAPHEGCTVHKHRNLLAGLKQPYRAIALHEGNTRLIACRKRFPPTTPT
jgi:putative transposase